MTDKELCAYCEDWVKWSHTRRFYLRSGVMSVLARLQPEMSGEPPDARNDAEMQYFNMAVHALAGMPEYKEYFACFRMLYIVERTNHVKCLADEMGISRMAYYKRARSFARRAYSMGKSLRAAQMDGKAVERI